jgi:cell division septum initiation protein DivIVA
MTDADIWDEAKRLIDDVERDRDALTNENFMLCERIRILEKALKTISRKLVTDACAAAQMKAIAIRALRHD